MVKKNARLIRKPDQKNRPGKNPQGSIQGDKKNTTPGGPAHSDLFSITNSRLSKNPGIILIASLLLTLVSGILLFDIRFSLAGDDSAYVERAFNFIHHFVFPTFQGPLYPVLLGPFVAVFGISAVPLKTISLICMLGFIYFMYRALKDNVPPLVMTVTLLLLSVNSSFLYYSSQTYSEAFFLFLQAITFFSFFKLFIDKASSDSSANPVSNHLILAVLVLCLGLTRSIGFASVLAFAMYFSFRAEWKNLIYFLGSFAVLLIIFLGIKSLIWGGAGIVFSGQAGGLLAKDYYNPGAGKEDVAGFFKRFIQNSNYYISKTIYVFLGFRKAGRETVSLTWLTILTILPFCGLFLMIARKNLYLFFTSIYTALSMAGMFIITQSMWMQDRLIIPYYPLILLLLMAFFYYLFCLKGWTRFQFIFPLLSLFLIISALRVTMGDINVVRQIKNQYSGLSPDWENYCKISEWTAKNLPPGSVTACRKPSISFIYSRGRNFFGIARVPSVSGDSMVQGELQKKQHFTFILTSSLSSHSVPRKIYYTFKKWLTAYGLIRKPTTIAVPYYVLKIPDNMREDVVQEMKNADIEVTDNFDTLQSWVRETEYKITIVFPDSLVDLLKRSGVTHVLTANLRADGATRNGNTNNTVERYVEYIRFKYPKFMTRICQMGAEDNEPASLYKVNYDMLRPDEPSE